jgi:RimJ/RimL family protein N-acetyltransferase
MFARTERLLLRPGFIEDAEELTAAVADEAIARNLARLPWPYRDADARAWLNMAQDDARLPTMLITQRTAGTPRIVGGIGIHPIADVDGGPDRLELGYWIARPYWGLGFATEAGRAVMAIARANRLPRLTSGHFIDNPASGAVLRKLGFRSTGRVVNRHSLARGVDVPCALFEEGDGDGDTPVMPRSRWNQDMRENIRLMAA